MTGCDSTQDDNTTSSIVQSENTLWETQDKTDLNKSDSGITTQDNETNEYPDAVINCYASFEEIIKKQFPQYSLSEIEESTVNDSNFFSFYINTKEDNTQPKVTFQNNKSSFGISLPDNTNNDTLKDVILCAIMSADNTIDINSANKLMQDLSNSFDGSSNSNVISTSNYKFYISSGSGLVLRQLNIISVSEINPSIKKEDYIKAQNKLFKGELNQGTKVYIQGTILGIYDLGTHWGLEISSGADTYCVYYNFDNFIDCFEVGDTYTFYGQIAAIRKGYTGCLRLDYFSNEE